MKKWTIAMLILTCMLGLTACSDSDDDQTHIRVQVAVRVDSHTPPQVTVFGKTIDLSNKNWRITLEFYRQYEELMMVPTSALKPVPAGPLPSNSPELEGIFAVHPEQGKTVFTVETQTTGRTYLFIIK